jgi:hypothetical protein
VSLLIPSETDSGLSVKAFSSAWQVAQLTLPVELNRLSSNSFFPRAIFSAVWGLSSGEDAGGSPRGGEGPDAATCDAWLPTMQRNATIRSDLNIKVLMIYPPFLIGDDGFPAIAVCNQTLS